MSEATPSEQRERWLTRADAAAYLRDTHGMRCSAQTLANYANRGTGPRFYRRGRAVAYSSVDLDRYANKRIEGPFDSTTAADAAQVSAAA